MLRDRDRTLFLVLSALAALAGTWLLASGVVVFWGDLTYLHHPWRALTAEQLQRGMPPLWNPYAYLGMPLAAEMQNSVWYPGTLVFHLFPFSSAMVLFHSMHYGLAGIFAFLWLRKEGLARMAALGGAFLFMGCGFMISRVPLLNHLSCLAYLPAFLLFRRHAWFLGLSLSLCFLSGYPTILAGGILAAFFLPLIAGEKESISWCAWLGAAGCSVAICACLFFPALQLMVGSHRVVDGLSRDDMLNFGLSPGDWVRFVSPFFSPQGAFAAARQWWLSHYLGFAAWIAISLSVPRLRPRAGFGLAFYLGVVVLLLLGGSNPVSLWLWMHLPPLRYIRYPSNLAFLALPAFMLLAAAGMQRRRWAMVLVAAMALELGWYATGSQPMAPRSYFTDAGPLVRELQGSLGGHRYLLSPRSLGWTRGIGRTMEAAAVDLKHRLYCLTNMPYHLQSVGNYGEPLVPRENYAFMDFLYRQKGLDASAPYLPWADAGAVLTRDRQDASRMDYRGLNLWHIYRTKTPSARAYWFNETLGGSLPTGLSEDAKLPDIRSGTPLLFSMEDEDRYRIQGGTKEGWVYFSQPRAPGWTYRLNGVAVQPQTALGVFQKLRVPAGSWVLRARYDPRSWRLGLIVTLLSLLAVSVYWYNRALRHS